MESIKYDDEKQLFGEITDQGRRYRCQRCMSVTFEQESAGHLTVAAAVEE